MSRYVQRDANRRMGVIVGCLPISKATSVGFKINPISFMDWFSCRRGVKRQDLKSSLPSSLLPVCLLPFENVLRFSFLVQQVVLCLLNQPHHRQEFVFSLSNFSLICPRPFEILTNERDSSPEREAIPISIPSFSMMVIGHTTFQHRTDFRIFTNPSFECRRFLVSV